MEPKRKRILLALFLLLVSCSDLCFGNEFCASPVHQHSHGHHHHHDCAHGHQHHHRHEHNPGVIESKLPEELAEEEDMKLYGFGDHDQDHHHHSGLELSGLGLWIHALGCSLLVSLASLICLIFLPVIFIKGKPSKAIVDSLALFGAGAMLGDAFLHQLPHAFGGEHTHSHDHHADNFHHAHAGDEHGQSHSHSLKDLSVGISVLAGIVLFLLVEKVVRYVEDNSTGANAWNHGHHHHNHNSSKKLKDDSDAHDKTQSKSSKEGDGKGSDEVLDDSSNDTKFTQSESLLRKRKTVQEGKDDKSDIDAADGSANNIRSLNEKEHTQSPSNLVFGYLNLISDGVMEWLLEVHFCFMDGYRESENRTRSETSGLTGHESVELAQQDSPMIESMSSEWTDEKHSLYLKSMEASFVNQLYNSIDLLGWRSQKGRPVSNLSEEVNCSTCRPSGQFKVLRRGGWKKINFRRPESQLSSANDSCGFLTSPWIKQFTPARKPEGATSPALQECAIKSRGINLNWKKAVLCCPATNSKLSHFGNSFSCHRDFVESNTEMSGQNFVDEDIEGERASSSFSSKRLKTLKTDPSSSDQVVPHSKTPVEEDVTECISAAK